MNCRSCGAALPDPPWFRNHDCPKCGVSLHACLFCGFYSPSHNNECREPMAERVVDKERANFCDYFKPGGGVGGGGDEKAKALSALEALFKK